MPARPGVCRTFFKAAAGRSSGGSSKGNSAVADAGPSKGENVNGKPAAAAAAVSLPSSLVRTLSEGLPHYLLQPQNLIDQDTVMLHQQVLGGRGDVGFRV